MKQRLLILLAFLFAHSAHANPWATKAQKSCPKDLTTEQVFGLLMKAEFAGVQLDGANPDCLKDELFPHQSVGPDFPQEAVEQKIYIIDESTLKVLKVKLVDDFQKIYEVQFQIEGTLQEGNKKEMINDSAMISIFPSARVQAKHGCGNFLERPQKVLIKKECLSK